MAVVSTLSPCQYDGGMICEESRREDASRMNIPGKHPRERIHCVKEAQSTMIYHGDPGFEVDDFANFNFRSTWISKLMIIERVEDLILTVIDSVATTGYLRHF